MDAGEVEKKLRALRKKLAQIQKLKEKGGDLDEEARKKVASEKELKEEVEALEAQLSGAEKAASPGGPQAPPAPAKKAAAKAASPQAPSPAEEAPPAPAKKAAAKATAPQPSASPVEEATSSPAKQAKAKPAATEEARAPAAEAPTEQVASGPSPEQEKLIRAVKKKLQQIQKLKDKAEALDADAREKVASEPRLLRELAALERGETPAEEEKPPVPSQSPKEELQQAVPEREDPHAAARAEALEAPPGDLGLLLDDETEKRFKSLQKKLRDIGKLHEKEKLDKLQQDKLGAEPGLIEELAGIRAKAAEKLAERRSNAEAAQKAASARKAAAPARKSGGGPAWECPNCGATGAPQDLESDCCPKCGFEPLMHFTPKNDDGDEEEEPEQNSSKDKQVKKKLDSQELKSLRQKKAPQAATKRDEPGTQVNAAVAKWPEVKDVLESGDGGVDKSRQKKAIAVERTKPEPPYDVFDSALLKCSFVTRIELKLPPGVLTQEAFQLYFPGLLSDGLLELILKENQLASVPAGLKDLKRIRSVDLSHNAISALPGPDTWESVSGSLELLDLSFNQLESIAELEPLTKLSSLKVDANKLNSLNGISWGKLRQLSMLTAVGNQIVEIPDEIEERADSLENVDLSDNKIVNVTTSLRELKKLKSLSLAGNPIKDQKVVKAAERGIKDLKAYLSKVPKGKSR